MGPLQVLRACLVTQSCPTLCDPMACSPQGSSVQRLLQAGKLEWVAISSSRGSSWSRDQTLVSYIGRQILYHWATWEALCKPCCCNNVQLILENILQIPDVTNLRTTVDSLLLLSFPPPPFFFLNDIGKYLKFWCTRKGFQVYKGSSKIRAHHLQADNYLWGGVERNRISENIKRSFDVSVTFFSFCFYKWSKTAKW